MNILCNENKVVLFVGDSIEYGVFDEPNIEKFKVTKGKDFFYVIGNSITLYEVSSIPHDYIDEKYCYTEANGFYINENYSEPINAEEEMKRLTQENIDLKVQLDKVQEVLDYLVMK